MRSLYLSKKSAYVINYCQSQTHCQPFPRLFFVSLKFWKETLFFLLLIPLSVEEVKKI